MPVYNIGTAILEADGEVAADQNANADLVRDAFGADIAGDTSAASRKRSWSPAGIYADARSANLGSTSITVRPDGGELAVSAKALCKPGTYVGVGLVMLNGIDVSALKLRSVSHEPAVFSGQRFGSSSLGCWR